jgi:hypothetical protein
MPQQVSCQTHFLNQEVSSVSDSDSVIDTVIYQAGDCILVRLLASLVGESSA